MAVHIHCVRCMLFDLACTPVCFPEKGAAPLNPMPTSGASLMLFCFKHSSNAVKMLSALVDFKGTMSMKYSAGKPFSTQRQKLTFLLVLQHQCTHQPLVYCRELVGVYTAKTPPLTH